jgi:hypothetical protein
MKLPKTTFVEFGYLLDKLLKMKISSSVRLVVTRGKATYIQRPDRIVIMCPPKYRDGSALCGRKEF